MMSIESRTDEAGRFKINPYPGVRFGIVAHPPDGSPFHVRHLDDLKWNSGDATKSIEIHLPEGVLAHGQVVDAETGDVVDLQAQQVTDAVREEDGRQAGRHSIRCAHRDDAGVV